MTANSATSTVAQRSCAYRAYCKSPGDARCAYTSHVLCFPTLKHVIFSVVVLSATCTLLHLRTRGFGGSFQIYSASERGYVQ